MDIKEIEEKILHVLSLLFIISVLFNAVYFLYLEGTGLIGWFSQNLCALSLMIFIGGVLGKKPLIRNISAPLLIFFGTTGLFIIPWNSLMGIKAQVDHILMIPAGLLALWVSYKNKEYKKIVMGIVFGAVLIFILGALTPGGL